MSTRKIAGVIAGVSIKVLLITILGIFLFGIYVGVLIYGENSLTVLNTLRTKKTYYTLQSQRLKNENRRLQKIYFELKQVESD